MGVLQMIITHTVNFISALGYWGVALGMLIESCNIPLPSEVILPFGGYLVSTGRLSFWGTVLAGLAGGTLGSALSYYIGRRGGRPLLLHYGRYIAVTEDKLNRADRWFARYGNITIMVARLVPIVRTFISFPAGITAINFPLFIIYTVLGSLPWCILLTWLGVQLGQNWNTLEGVFHRLDFLVVAALVLLCLAVWWHRRRKR
jgi:membrane protein DedA with SNARE-associated domain